MTLSALDMAMDLANLRPVSLVRGDLVLRMRMHTLHAAAGDTWAKAAAMCQYFAAEINSELHVPKTH